MINSRHLIGADARQQAQVCAEKAKLAAAAAEAAHDKHMKANLQREAAWWRTLAEDWRKVAGGSPTVAPKLEEKGLTTVAPVNVGPCQGARALKPRAL